MAILGPIAALLGIELDALMDRIKRNAITYAVVALLSFIALCFLLVASHIALSYAVGPLWSALIIAGVAILAVVIIVLWAGAAEKARQRRVVERRRSTDATALITTAALTALPMVIRNPAIRIAAVPLGILAGYFALSRRDARKPEDD